MKFIIFLFFIASIGSIITGYFIESELSEKFIGFGVIGLFLVVIPMFSYYRWKDKKVQDYLLTKENLDKMREQESKKED